MRSGQLREHHALSMSVRALFLYSDDLRDESNLRPTMYISRRTDRQSTATPDNKILGNSPGAEKGS